MNYQQPDLKLSQNIIDIIWDKKLNITEIQKKLELINSERIETSAYYTDPEIVKDIVSELPSFKNKNKLRILEPAVGIGSFLWQLSDNYKEKNLEFILVDINPESMLQIKELLQRFPINNATFKFIISDFLKTNFMGERIDLVIGNPPFGLIKKDHIPNGQRYLSNNLAAIFLEKIVTEPEYISLILPKSILSAPKFTKIRECVRKLNVHKIFDFGEYGFRGVKIETINIMIDNRLNDISEKIMVKSWVSGETYFLEKEYLMDKNYPYWLIYRNQFFDLISKKLEFNTFDVFRDRQISKKIAENNANTDNRIWVLRSRNFPDGNHIQHISEYDMFIDKNKARELNVYNFLNKDVYIVPNLSYKPRSVKLPSNTIVDGSLALLIPKNKKPTNRQLKYYSSKEFRDFYKIARNLGTRSLNIDKLSVFFFGLLK